MRLAVFLCALAAVAVVTWAVVDPPADRVARRESPAAAPRTAPSPEPPASQPRARPALMGRVVDPAGAPVAGARVLCNDMNRTVGWKKARRLATDSEGRFRLEAQATLHELLVAADGFGETHVYTYPDDPDLCIVLQPACTLAGDVRTPDGRPAAGAELSIWDSTVTARTDAHGRFEVGGVRPGEITMHAYWNGPVHAPRAPRTWWRWDWHLEAAPGERRDGLELTIEGARYSWLPLRCVTPAGAPVAGARIVDTGTLNVLDDPRAPTVYDAEREEEYRVTDAGGLVLLRVQDQPGYETAVRVASGDWWWRRTVRTVPPGSADVVTCTLTPPIHVTLLVLDEAGRPVPEARVEVSDRGEPLRSDGHRHEFRVDPGEDGFAYYTVDAPGYAYVEERWRPLPYRTEVILRREARVRGRIVDPPAGRKMGAWIGGTYAPAAADGRFELDSLRAGPTVVRIVERWKRGTWLRREVTLGEGDHDLGDLRLERARTIDGRVVTPDGDGVGGARVQVLEPGVDAYDAGVSRPDGRFEVALRSTAAVRLVARKPGRASAATPPGEELVAHPSPSLRFRPPDTDWHRAELRSADGHRLTIDRMSFRWTFRGEGLRFIDLPQGAWRLVLVGASGVDEPVELAPGRESVLDLR